MDFRHVLQITDKTVLNRITDLNVRLSFTLSSSESLSCVIRTLPQHPNLLCLPLCILGIISTLSIWLTPSPDGAEVATVIPNTLCAIFYSRTGELQQTVYPLGPAVTLFEKKTEMIKPLWPLTLTWLTRSSWLDGQINLITVFKLQDMMIHFSRGYCYIQ